MLKKPDNKTAILKHKGIGCYTNGDISETIQDAGGYANTIRFMRPTDVPIYVDVTIVQYTGWMSTMIDDIKNAIVNYLTGFDINADISLSLLNAAIIGANEDLKHPAFGVSSLLIGKSAGTVAASDIVIDYNEVASIDPDDITISV